MKEIKVYNAKIHNLQNINVRIPKNQFVAVTGVSGSGKSSFMFDILHREGQRLYLEALGINSDGIDYDSFDMIKGLSPTIAVQQRTISNANPRSVVGTVTRILSLLAIIYANEGNYGGKTFDNKNLQPGMFMFNSPQGSCNKCDGRGSITQVMLSKILPSENASIQEWHDLAYYYPNKKKDEKEYIAKRLADFCKIYQCTEDTVFSQLPAEAKEAFLNYRPKRVRNKGQLIFYGIHAVLEDKIGKREANFKHIQTTCECPVCQGYRIRQQAFEILINEKHIGELCKMNISELRLFLDEYESTAVLSPFTKNILNEIKKKLKCLETVGLYYLDLYREMPTLSGGEVQRLHIMSHLSSKFDSVIYIFDEPTSGLHEIEKQTVIQSFKNLRDGGNTVIVIEHDESVIRQAEYILDFGPKAGKYGGELIYQGDSSNFITCKESLTAAYLYEKKMPEKDYSVKQKESILRILDASANNLKHINVDIPLHQIVGISGPSASGKSSLIMETLLPQMEAGRLEIKLMDGDHLDGYYEVDQKLPGRHENSCVATFLGIWDNIRKLFAAQDEAIELGFNEGYFSFNAAGCCTECNGNGYIKRWIGNMAYSESCPACNGKRFAKMVLQIRYKGLNIADILQMSAAEALLFFEESKKIYKMLKIISDIGMGYILLGQRLQTLSGGEAQRLKLAKSLGKGGNGNYLYVLDEPTVGLSYYDTEKLLILLNRLVLEGNSIIIIEHDPYILSYCDHIIELGPMGGKQGGEIIAEGSPHDISCNPNTKIGTYLTLTVQNE